MSTWLLLPILNYIVLFNGNMSTQVYSEFLIMLFFVCFVMDIVLCYEMGYCLLNNLLQHNFTGFEQKPFILHNQGLAVSLQICFIVVSILNLQKEKDVMLEKKKRNSKFISAFNDL